MAICPTCNGTGQVGGGSGTGQGSGVGAGQAGSWPGAQGAAQASASSPVAAAQQRSAPSPLVLEANPPIRTYVPPRTGGLDPAIGNPGPGGAWNPNQVSTQRAPIGTQVPQSTQDSRSMPVPGRGYAQAQNPNRIQGQPGIMSLANNIRR